MFMHGCLTTQASIELDPKEHIAYKWVAEAEVLASSDLLPCVPTMIAHTLNSQAHFDDLTMIHGTRVTAL
jgi:hypothetical protein